jgi:hypothetical protein
MKSASWAIRAAALFGVVLFVVSRSASAALIAWVSIHPGDTMPTTGAQGQGFTTTAPDKGYTDALTAAGHTVQRFTSHDNPTAADLTTLSAYDLVIVGRSVPSAHYQAAAESLFWNTTLTKPLIHMGGFSIRGGTGGGSRLGLYSNETLVDSTTSTKLIAADPSHPIFAGIALDGTKTMVNNYANVVSLPHAPGTLQRGISTGTPIAAGGQILATVAAGDPTAGGTVIALFPPGTTMQSNPTSVTAAHRLMFLSGSREHAATPTSADIAGIYDLTPDGSRMFLNAVDYMVAIPEPSTAILLIFAVAGLGMLRRKILRRG